MLMLLVIFPTSFPIILVNFHKTKSEIGLYYTSATNPTFSHNHRHVLGCNQWQCQNTWLIQNHCQSQWPRGLRRRTTAARLLRLWVRIQPRAWMFVCCECCVLSGRGLCAELITRPEESYRLCCVVVCDLETSWMRRPWPTVGMLRQKKKIQNH